MEIKFLNLWLALIFQIKFHCIKVFVILDSWFLGFSDINFGWLAVRIKKSISFYNFQLLNCTKHAKLSQQHYILREHIVFPQSTVKVLAT